MMKEKLNAMVEELEIVANIAVYAVVLGAALEFGKRFCNRIFR